MPSQQSSHRAFNKPLHAPNDMDDMQESQAGPSKRPASAMDLGSDANAPARKKLTTTRPPTGQLGPSKHRASAPDEAQKKLKTSRPATGQAKASIQQEPTGPRTRPASAPDGNTPAQKVTRPTTGRPPTSQAKGKKRVLTDSMNSPGQVSQRNRCDVVQAVELEGGASESRKGQNPRKKTRETDEQRKRRNRNAREARAKPGSTYQHRMPKRRDELRANPNRNTDIAIVLADIFWGYAARFEKIQTDVDASTDSTMVVKSVVKKSRECDYIAPISDNSAVWTHLQPAINLLADCAVNPFQIDVDHWISEGVLVEVDDAINNCVAEFYLRIITFPNKIALCNAILKYIATFPADLSVAILWLAILGHPADDIKSAVRSSLLTRGYALAADELVGLLGKDDLETLNLGIKQDSPVYLPYAGFTIAGGPKARLEADQLDDCRRFPNFLLTMDSDLSITTYRFAGLDYPAPSPLCYRTDPIIGQIEATCIDALCTATLNSRRGGIPDSEYLPPAEIAAVVIKMLECYPRISLENCATTDSLLTHSLRGLHDDELDALTCNIPEYKPISAKAFENIKRMSADIVRKVDGAVLTVDLGKDIPFEESSGRSGGIYDEDIGEGLRLQRHIMSLIYPDIPTTGSLEDHTIIQFFGPFVDFWRLVSKGFIHWSAAYLSRYLCVLQPLVIVAFSGPVNRMLRGGSLADVWSKCEDNDTRGSFLDGKSPANLSEFCRDNEETFLPKYEGDGFTDVLGTLARISYGSKPWQQCLTIAARDPGSEKYDPVLALLRLLVKYLVQAKAELLKRVAARRQSTNPFPVEGDKEAVVAWLDAVRSEVDGHTAEHGFEDKLQCAIANLRQREKVVAILRLAKLDDGLPVPVPVARGPLKPSRHHDDPYYHAAPAGKQREAQYQQILVREREREHVPGNTSPIIPFGMTLNSIEFRNHIFGLADGTYLIASANSYGRTPEAQARVAENTAALVKHNVLQGKLRDKVRAVMENEALSGLLAVALKDVVDYETHALKTPKAIANTWRWTTCGNCNGVLVALVRNHKHRCEQNDCEAQEITAAHVSGLQRLLYPHDILGNAILAPLLQSTPTEFNLTSVSVRDFLQQHIQLLPAVHRPLEDIPPELAVFVRPSYSIDFILTMCIDAGYPYLTTCQADPDATNESDRNRPWEPQKFEPIWKAIRNRTKLYVSKCLCGFLGIGIKKTPRHMGRDCPYSGAYGQAWKPVYSYTITSFFEFPRFWARRLLYYGRVEGRAGGLDILAW